MSKCIRYFVDPNALATGVSVECLPKLSKVEIFNPELKMSDLNGFSKPIPHADKAQIKIEWRKTTRDTIPRIVMHPEFYLKALAGKPTQGLPPEIAPFVGQKCRLVNRETRTYAFRYLQACLGDYIYWGKSK